MFRYIVILFSLFSCISGKKLIDGYSVIRFKERSPYKSEYKMQDYLLDIPKGGILTKVNTGDYFREYRIKYPDSSIIYIMNDSRGGSRLNLINRFEKNIKAIIRRAESDTLDFGGIQKDGKHWKEKFVGEIVVGYVNAMPDSIEKFEKALSSLRKVK